MLAHGNWVVALAVFVFAIALPPVKLVALIVLGTIPGRLPHKRLARTLRAVDRLGRWGMLDVLILLVAVLLAFVQLGDVVEFQAGPGVFAFGLFVLLSLLAAYFFDPHALWDEGPMADNPQDKETDRDTSADAKSHKGTQNGGDERAAGLPTANVARARRPVWLWTLPILALVAVAVLGYREWQRRGPVITITFSEGHGLTSGDPLRYRGTVAGRVERLALSEDLDAIQVKVRLHPDAEMLARAGSRFWIVRPELSLTEVAGLETLVGANYLAVLPGPLDEEFQYSFVGLEEAPLLDVRESGGINVVLNAADASGLAEGSPVYYRQLRVGGVREVTLASDGSAVKVSAYIRPAFRQLVLPDTRFWKASGIRIEADWEGVTMEMGAAQTLLQAGIALAVPPNGGEPVEQGHEFLLHEEPQEAWLEWKPALGTGTVPENLPPMAWGILEWTVPGYVYNSVEKHAGWFLSTEGGLIGPKNLLTEPSGAKPNTTRLFVAGRRLNVPEDLASAGEGIGRLEIELEDRPFGPVTLREVSAPEDILVVTEPEEGPVFVSAAKLEPEEGYWLVDSALPLGPSWHGAAAVSVEDGAVVGLLLLDDERPRIGLYRGADGKQD